MISCSTVQGTMTCVAIRRKRDNPLRQFPAFSPTFLNKFQRRTLRIVTFSVALFASLLSASAQEPQKHRLVANIFDPLSTPAREIYDVSILVLIICAAIFFVVSGILVYTMIKYRQRPGDDGREPPQVYGGTQIELAWTVIPILITIVLIAITSRTIGEIQNAKMPENAVKVRLVGHQWWWEIHYPDHNIVTANEIHIPVSSREERIPTAITLQSADVIHSFWVPQLAGKTDLIPNRNNETWVEPFETGVYYGNCAEYCGTQHAHMLLRVIVHTPEDFQKWVASQKQTPVDDPLVATGKDLFYSMACISCHTVDGTIAEGTFGPDLTHLMSRQTLGAGVAPMTVQNLRAWVRDPQTLKPGCLMPDMKLLDDQVDQITAYLQTLK